MVCRCAWPWLQCMNGNRETERAYSQREREVASSGSSKGTHRLTELSEAQEGEDALEYMTVQLDIGCRFASGGSGCVVISSGGSG